jgi:dienelactone hydrolase
MRVLIVPQCWDVNNFPPSDWAPFKTWIASLTYEAVSKSIQDAHDYLKANGCENIFVVGFCWGGMSPLLVIRASHGAAVA